ncbi:single-stranded DNA-binding protein [Geoalkalibacter halelectricus]|uniref:single-stranded DNA-binding protein n=1 Tax=Geoalkalibacter halelectricus TaxID=2847045 RepID=UPI00266FE6A6|nr:single-stranded DNA-binding protein [Geoalkalibacter halelectricus]MDO3380404.1 single-stranded DNA-binding protein [Geoalkalibacter halelectricus]
MLNEVRLIGNVGKEPDLRYTANGIAVASFSLATSEKFKDKSGEIQEKTEWHNIVVWRGLAENVGKNLDKGRQVYVGGKLQTRKYQDKNNQDRYIVEIVADQVKFLGKADRSPANAAEKSGQASEEDYYSSLPEEIPF